MTEFKEKVVDGVLWVFLANLAGFVVNFSLGIWLARILGPNAYGLVGMVLVITGFAHLLLDFGFGEALVQRQEVSQSEYSSVFWLNMVIALCLTLLVYLSAPLIARFYGTQEIIPLCRALSLIFLLNGAAIVQRTRLEKSFRFKALGMAEVVSALSAVGLAIILALNGIGVWSLVALHLSKPLIYNMILWISANWRPSFEMNWGGVRSIARFSSALFLNGVLGTLSLSLDRLLIGKWFGAASLGLYSKSMATVRMPVDQIMSVVGRVIYPAFAEIQTDRKRIYQIYKKVVLVIATLVFPIMASFYFFGEDIISFLFGSKWIEMIPIFKILAITVGFIPFNILADNVIKSQGRVDLLNAITFIEKPLVIVAVLIGLYLGSIQTVALAFGINIVLVFMIKAFLVTRALETDYAPLLGWFAKSLRVVALPIISLGLFAAFGASDHLALRVGIFLLALGGSIWFLKPTVIAPFEELYRTYRDMKIKRAGS